MTTGNANLPHRFTIPPDYFYLLIFLLPSVVSEIRRDYGVSNVANNATCRIIATLDFPFI
jgi:hypothetical protein